METKPNRAERRANDKWIRGSLARNRKIKLEQKLDEDKRISRKAHLKALARK